MEELNKDFAPLELAFRMKALAFYNGKHLDFDIWDWEYPDGEKRRDIGECRQAPTFSQAFRWFRKTYSLQHSIDPTSDQQNGELGYNYWIWNYKTGEEYHSQNKNRPVGDWEYKHHEEAELGCLEKLIEIAEHKQLDEGWEELKDAGLDNPFKGW